MQIFIKKFEDISIADLPAVGGKNSSLGEMFNHLTSKGISVPDGFATTAFAFQTFLDFNRNDLSRRLNDLLKSLNRKDFSNLKEIGKRSRDLIMQAEMPDEIAKAIAIAYRDLCNGNDLSVAVRS